MLKSLSLVHGSVALLCVLLLAPVVSAQVIVPDVTGTLLPVAEAMLVGQGLVVGDQEFLFNEFAPQGQVLDQNPFAGSNVVPGTAVKLWISAGPHPCPDLFDYSQQDWKANIGGRAVADAITTVDTDNDLPEYHDYATWDVNEDGILDITQVSLLMHVLCLPPGTQHPTIDIAAVQATFQQNLLTYDDFLTKIRNDEADLIGAAPALMDMGTELLNKATAVSMQNDIVVAEAFLSGTVPDEWVGKTYADIANFMYDAGDGITWAVNKNYIGNQVTSTAWVALNNAGTRILVAALMGLEAGIIDDIFASSEYDELLRALSLLELDWNYLDTLFVLDPVILQDIEDASDQIEVTQDDVPEQDVDFDTFESEPGTELLDPDTEWGPNGETLEELTDTVGDDPEQIWDEAEEDFTAPVPDVTGMLLATAQADIISAGFVVGDVAPMYDDVAPVGTVLDLGSSWRRSCVTGRCSGFVGVYRAESVSRVF